MRQLLLKALSALDARDVLAFAGLAMLGTAAALLGHAAGRALVGAGGALFVVGAGLFYLGVWHAGRR